LDSADIFLNTSKVDNTPVTIIEALATGLPVVTTRVGGIEHLLTHGRHGLLCDPEQLDLLAREIERLLSEPDLCKTLSLEGRALVEHWDWREVLPIWSSLLGGVARSHDIGVSSSAAERSGLQ